jgi:hypothetical protein
MEAVGRSGDFTGVVAVHAELESAIARLTQALGKCVGEHRA